ncbi:MAG: FtsX-like permease family protein [Gemmatimonadales bacterium]
MAQVALGLVLVVGAGLLARSLGRLMAVDPGFRVDRALMATIELPSARYPDPAAQSRFFLELTDRLERLPGVVSAAASTQVPLEGYGINFSYWIEGDGRSESDRPNGDFRVVTPGYFATAGIPILRGRGFDGTDQAGGVPVIIVDETLARLEFGSDDPVGRRMNVSYGGEAGPRTIVGVVGAVRQRRLESESYPGYYLPIRQVTWSTMRVLLRASGDPAALTESLRRETAALDPALAVRGVRTLDEHLAAAVGSPRFNALLIASFAAVTLLLALSGIYSLMTYLVAQRTHEIGVRMALGERRAQVRRAVAGTGVRLALVGVGLGLLAAAGVARLLRELLFEVGPGDPLTFLSAALTFLLVAWIGSYLPARRASTVDPLIALRGD